MRVMLSRKCMNYQYYRSDHRYYRSVNYRYYRWMAAQFCVNMNYRYYRSETDTIGGDRYYR
jgi:hypothetical protein